VTPPSWQRRGEAQPRGASWQRRGEAQPRGASWQSLPGPVRAIGTAVTRAVDAADATDRVAYESAAAAVVALPTEATGLVVGAVNRELIEEQHPDGLDGDDIQVILARCYRNAAAWLGDIVDVRVLVAVLASALGIHEAGLTYQEVNSPNTATDEWPPPEVAERAAVAPPSPAEFAWHAPLVLADLLAACGRPLSPYLDSAFAEIARGEAMDLP
jgi:hypothetical protein